MFDLGRGLIIDFFWGVLSLFSLAFWRTTALFVVAVGQTLFVALYMTFPWYKTFLGRALFYKAIMLGILTDLFLVARYFDFAGLDALFIAVYLLLGVGVWWQFFAFLRVRRAGRQNSPNPGHNRKPDGPVESRASLRGRDTDLPETHQRF